METKIEHHQEKIIEKYLARIQQLEIEKKHLENELYYNKELQGEITSSLDEFIVPSHILTKTYELIRGQFGKRNIKIDFTHLKETAPINLNSNYLQQIFLNLLLNAKNNLLNGGKLIVETQDEDAYILIRIKDNGEPMSPEFIARAKDPFKKQTEVTETVQLGFAVSIQMINDVKGLVQMNASKRLGNEIIVHLPKNTKNQKEAVDVL